MLAISPSQRILLGVQAVDFRKGIDGLIGLCRQQFNENPLMGTLFVFTNRRRTMGTPSRPHGLRYGGRCMLYPPRSLVIPWQPQSRIRAQVIPALDQGFEVSERIGSRLGGRLDHTH